MALFIFDKDGTLITGKRLRGGRIRNPARPEEQEVLPGVREKLDHLRERGHTIAMASNSALVAKGLLTLEEAERLMVDCAEKVGGVAAWKVCGYDPKARKTIDGCPNPYAMDADCHKPHPGMILELMAELGFGPAETWLVGNSKKDEQAARAAWVNFARAKDFFGLPIGQK